MRRRGAALPRRLRGYTRHENDRGGGVTWDVPIEPSGRIPEPYLAQLGALGRGLG